MASPPADFNFPLRLGFGCAGAWGKQWFDARQAKRVVSAALGEGIRHFDTAGFYSGGEAERRLGAALADCPSALRDDVFISTKTGTRYRGLRRAQKDFSLKAIQRDVEASLKRLGRERLDLVYLHGPSESDLRQGIEALFKLKAKGTIVRAGVCGAGSGLAQAAETPGVDVIMGVYNILRREHDGIFHAAQKRGVGIVAIAPLAQGLYRRDMLAPRSLPDVWHLARALIKNRAELAAARAAGPLLESFEGWTPAQIALGFALAHPAVDVAVATTTRCDHLAALATVPEKPLPTGALERLSELAALTGLDAPAPGA